MARKKKEVALVGNKEQINRREVGYYATPEFISHYISLKMMKIKSDGKSLLDPCCGKEELLDYFVEKKISIDGMDIIKYKDKYKCNFKNTDFIEYYCKKIDDKKSDAFSLGEDEKLDYDYYIANPPYNCHEVNFIKENKKRLKNYFGDIGVHNMYSMFISAIIEIAKEGAVIGLITHDSFFTSKFHEGLRKKILKECTIHEITMCPTDLFLHQGADVRTSIVILEKGIKNQREITINNRPINSNELMKVLNKNIKDNNYSKYKLRDIVLNNEIDNNEFIIECPKDIKILFNNERLGQSFNCITGISTGNDKEYLSKEMKEPYIVPFYKNPGKNRFYTSNYIYIHKDFLRLHKEVKTFMVRNKSLIFKGGVTCSSMGVEFTASKLPLNSTFGVNPNIICDEYDSWWLLAYLNSTLVTYIVRGILIRSNMITSGYVWRIPLISFTINEKDELSRLSKIAYNLACKNESIEATMIEIDKIINKSANISNTSINIVNEFKKNLVKNT